jgi:hypothetical protein
MCNYYRGLVDKTTTKRRLEDFWCCWGTNEELRKSSCWVVNVLGVLSGNHSLLFHLA